MDVDKFRLRYPEFNETPTAMLQAALDDAATEVDPAIWGDMYDKGHGAMTAHLLATSPFGQANRLVPKDGKTGYLKEFERMTLIVTCGSAHVANGVDYKSGIPWPW